MYASSSCSNNNEEETKRRKTWCTRFSAHRLLDQITEKKKQKEKRLGMPDSAAQNGEA